MIRRWDKPVDKRQVRRRFGSSLLKVCPVCGTLNVEEVAECFSCWWAGAFEHDPALVRLKVAELVARCPELIGLLEEPPKPLTRFRHRMRRVFGKIRQRLDVRA